MLQNYKYYASIMPNAPDKALCSKLCRHNPTVPAQSKGGSLDPPLQIDKYKDITEFDVYSVKTFNDIHHIFKHVTT